MIKVIRAESLKLIIFPIIVVIYLSNVFLLFYFSLFEVYVRLR